MLKKKKAPMLMLLGSGMLLAIAVPRAASPKPAHFAPPAPAGDDLLARHVPEVRFDSMTLEDALSLLADVTHTTIVTDWHSLRSEQFHKATPVKARIWDTSLSNALGAVLASVG